MDKRIKLFRIVIIILFSVLVLRAGHLQLIQGDYYYQLSEGNRISLRPIEAPRGKIFDRSGKELGNNNGDNILVTNKLSYNLYLLPNEVPPRIEPEELLQTLCAKTGLNSDNLIESYYRNKERTSGSSAIILKRNLSSKTMIVMEEIKKEVPGILVKESSIRDYVYGDFASHMLGYVGEISLDELKQMQNREKNYNARDIVGKSGLEKEYEAYLKGINGIEQIEVNSYGQKVRTLGTKPPIPGNDLVLNMDRKLQRQTEILLHEEFLSLRRQAEEEKDGTKGPTGAAAIVMEVNSGRILAMTSMPDYDLNKFAEGFSGNDYQELATNPLNPLLNRAIMSVLPPGSIFKLVTATAAIENLGVTAETKFIDENGVFRIPNWSRPYRNWHYGGEGELGLTRAIARSNNIIFYELGYRLYQEYKGKKLIECAREYGLGSKTGIDLPGEKSGLVPDAEWKKKKYNQGWYPGDSVNISIGQGGLLTTPIQLINMAAAIANNGIMYKPYLVDKIVSTEGNIIRDFKPEVRKYLKFDDDVYQILQEGMTEVTSTDYGTAGSIFSDFPVEIAGKTGTAQTSISSDSHGWFVGFAPASDPEVALLVFLENGESSSRTLPIAAGILRSYFGFDKDKWDKLDPSYYFREGYFKTTHKLFEFFEKVFSKDD